MYELHVGTFSQEGTYDGVRKRLPFLRDLGINAIELMPLADFPGRWNWGYDPGSFYAPSRNYGRPDDLRRLVDEAHQMGDRKSTRLNSSHVAISYAVFCLKK